MLRQRLGLGESRREFVLAFADDELRSAPIRAGEFASFCELRPGRYEYKVVRPIRVKPDEASRELKGEIVVGDPDA